MKDVSEILRNLKKDLTEILPRDVTSCEIFVNCEGIKMTLSNTFHEDLKREGYSMQNLKGEFIKDWDNEDV